MAPDHEPIYSRVLLFGTDPGFLFALAFELQKLRIAALAACSFREANTVLAEFGPQLDLLIVKCSIRGSRRVAANLLLHNPGLPIIGIVPENRTPSKRSLPFVAYLRDPDDLLPQRAGECARLVQSLIRRRDVGVRRSRGSARG